jgi:hypothetical protein
VALVNDLYSREWRALQNFFLPTMRLLCKHREGGHLRRRHSAPRTPYERLLESPRVLEENKQRLRREFESLDPFALSEAIETKLRAIFRLVRKTSRRVEKTLRAA